MIVWKRIDASKLNPLLKAAVDNVLGPLPDIWYATYGWRSTQEQTALWLVYKKWMEDNPGKKGGPRAAPPGHSPHEWGLAIDVVLDQDAEKQGLQPSWDLNDPRWARLIDAVKRSKWLHSGVSFGDAGHIELVNWKHRIVQ